MWSAVVKIHLPDVYLIQNVLLIGIFFITCTGISLFYPLIYINRLLETKVF